MICRPSSKFAVLDKGRERDQAEMALARLLGQRFFDVDEESIPSTFDMIALSEEPPRKLLGFSLTRQYGHAGKMVSVGSWLTP